MSDDTLAAWLTLLDSGLSHAVLRRALVVHHTPEALLGASDAALIKSGLLADDQCRRLRESAEGTLRRRRQLDSFHRLNMRLLTPADADWPENLRPVAEPPVALFVRGEIRDEDRLAVAIVGSRLATPYGLEVTRRLAVELAPVVTVASGLANGIDATAHERTLDAGGRSFGVAACGLDIDYPKGLGPMRERLVGAGALISLFPPGTTCGKGCFPRRNHLLACLCLGVIVVEAGETSGALLTARSAIEENREVLAVPGDITRPASRGTNRLIAEGAAVITEPADVVRHLEQRLSHELRRLRARRESSQSAEVPAPDNLTPAESTLLAAIRKGPISHDDLIAQFVPSALTMGDIAAALLALELKGLVQTLPGRTYTKR